MINFLIIPTIFFLSISVLGYGFFFKKIFFKEKITEFGLYGIFGIIFLTFYSYVSNLFISHGYIHNSLIHIFGIILFIFFFYENKNYKIISCLIVLLFLLIPSIYIYKTHDDFPYYHLPYIVNIIENKILIGNGNFGLAHRTHSSIFYYSSLFYLPFYGFKFLNFTYFSTLLFSNLLILEKLFYKKNFLKHDLTYYLYLLTFIFINVIFYRISEYGTDRTGQIFIFF